MLRPWDLKIVLRKGAKAAVFLQIAHAIIDEIKLGRLAPGTALPGSRELAESLEINRKTVIQAYAELEAQG
jgi:GntR family transcriptional regulator / MocR family aminotransferase